MAEKCGKCSSTAPAVTIGGRAYCGHCGEAMPRIVKPSMQDLGVRRTAVAKPAAAVHSRAGLARGGVIDLRAQSAEAPKITPTRRKPALAVRPAAAEAPAPQLRQHTAIGRSEHISRFHTKSAEEPKPEPVPTSAAVAKSEPAHHAKLPAHTETHHRAMAKLVAQSQKAPTHPKTIPALHRYAAASIAVVIMGGYIWMQNYPKLELHSASSKAGFALTLPSYLPSSYSLNGPVQAKNGTAVMSFKSPAVPSQLQITQHVTTWDSSSLRDNVVATKDANFTAVQGQGLTIYIWGQNQAAWVNHGIWYGIEGAANLSREQLLKIAYSL